MRIFHFFIVVILTIILSSSGISYATNGDNGIHDPSNIIKHEGVYHVFGTGHGDPANGVPVQTMVHKTSTDLINWKTVQPVWSTNQIPDWVYNYVPNFGGIFWAPEVIFMNGKYHLYYSVSMGDRESAIGVATSTDLYNWTDQGMVIYSDKASTYGSIDPAIFADADGQYWMAFGSHLRGIWLTQIDPATGKRPENAVLKNVAGSGGSWSEHEAAYVILHDGYYYLFFNVGTCCALLESTYTVMMGRSTNVLGPYVDKNGKLLSNGGGTVALASAGRFIGPGHFGLLREDKRNILSLHYYDGTSNGYPRLDVASLEFGKDGWPVVNRNPIPDGNYKIANAGNGLVWETQGCTGKTLQPLIQSTPDASATCQEWEISAVGNGFYKLKNAVATGTEQVVDIPFCDTNQALATWDWLDNDCQKFRIMQHANGSYVFLSSVNPDKVIAVPQGSEQSGTQLATLTYSSGNAAHQWSFISLDEEDPIEEEPEVTSVSGNIPMDPFSIYPNPSANGSFTIKFESSIPQEATIDILNLNGKVLYHQNIQPQEEVHIKAPFTPGVYAVRVHKRNKTSVKKLIIN